MEVCPIETSLKLRISICLTLLRTNPSTNHRPIGTCSIELIWKKEGLSFNILKKQPLLEKWMSSRTVPSSPSLQSNLLSINNHGEVCWGGICMRDNSGGSGMSKNAWKRSGKRKARTRSGHARLDLT